MTTLALRTADPAATQGVGAAIADVLQPGDVVALSGELGAGKTCLVQGLAGQLGVEARVTSPTFVLVRTYTGTLPLVHVDVYRLDHLQDVHDLGDDVFAPDVVTVVEWGDAIATVLPADHLDVDIVLDGEAAVDDDGDVARRVRVTGHGRWADRMGDLAQRCDPWTTTQPTNDGRTDDRGTAC